MAISATDADRAQLAVAAWLRREATLPLKWFAVRFHMGTWKSAGSRLRAWKMIQDKHPKQ